ncbi:SDR family NAD(P)-dependent oxidoreductase [Rhodococcus sp. HNM0563]|nr:SDR family NAD(P)-dependent oxidoreductase [Rhodococcus sp. HNM0563]
MRKVIPHMIHTGGGRIVSILSVAGIRWGGVAYAAYYSSKRAAEYSE